MNEREFEQNWLEILQQAKQAIRGVCADCNGTGYTNDGGNVFPCWCELGCTIVDEEE